MEIADLITPRSVIAQLRATNKKQALQELAKRAAALTGAPERTIYDVLIERERHDRDRDGDRDPARQAPRA
jgi:PTS system nitrogen regulatory IIA component